MPDVDASYAATPALCDVIAHHFDGAVAFIPAIDGPVAEVLDTREHRPSR